MQPLTDRRQPSAAAQVIDLILVELTNWRWSWRSMIVVDTLAPLASILALGIFARDGGRATLDYVLAGNLVMALMFGNLNKVSGRFAFMRYSGNLDYYATLPIHKLVLIAAVVLSFLLFSLPSALALVAAGVLYLRLPLALHPALLPAVFLCAAPLSGVGALLGARARSPQEANSLTLLVMLILMAIGPVVIPPSRLPQALLVLGYLSPATYAASALRQTLLGPVTPRLLLDLVALAGFTVAIFYVVARSLDWRQG